MFNNILDSLQVQPFYIPILSGILGYFLLDHMKKVLLASNAIIIDKIDANVSLINKDFILFSEDFSISFNILIDKYYTSVNIYINSLYNFRSDFFSYHNKINVSLNNYFLFFHNDFRILLTSYIEYTEIKSSCFKEIDKCFTDILDFLGNIHSRTITPNHNIIKEVIFKNHALEIIDKTELLKKMILQIESLKSNNLTLNEFLKDYDNINRGINSIQTHDLNLEIKFFSEQTFEGIHLLVQSLYAQLYEENEKLCVKFDNFINISFLYIKKLIYKTAILELRQKNNISSNTEITLLKYQMEGDEVKFFKDESKNFTFYIVKTLNRYQLYPVNMNLIKSIEILRNNLFINEKNSEFVIKYPPICEITEFDIFEVKTRGKLT